MAANHPWPSERQIAVMHQDDVFNIVGRQWSCFPRRAYACQHPLMHGAELGPWHVDVCDTCGHTEVQCLHHENEWNEAGTLLRCKNCGMDGT